MMFVVRRGMKYVLERVRCSPFLQAKRMVPRPSILTMELSHKVDRADDAGVEVREGAARFGHVVCSPGV